MTAERHPARNQILPSNEADLLNSLSGLDLYMRVRELYDQGWTLRSIGDSLNPKRPRSTIRYWVTKPLPIAGAFPTPSFPVATAPVPVQVRSKTPKARRHMTPGEKTRVFHLAPIARRFRASMNPAHPAALANEELSDLVVRLYQDNVPIRELADVAGVSYRAMARRIERATS